jgi:flagellar P-ring protein FlgI
MNIRSTSIRKNHDLLIWLGTLTLVAFALLFPMRGETAARLKDIASVKGVRENILIGYGLVVGLKGTGDSSSEVTAGSLARLFGKLGLDVQQNAGVRSKNAAAVIVTSKLPAFAKAGIPIDVTVSSIGDASSLEGGVLLVTPLRGGDQNVYAVAQGSVTLGALVDGNSKQFPTVGRVISGATIEKDIDTNFAAKKSFRLSLANPDFTTSTRIVALINQELGGKYASARDSATLDVVVPFNYEGNTVELLSRLENIKVNIDNKSKVVLNEKTGTIVMGDKVGISAVAIAHGDLSIEVKETPAAPAAQPEGENIDPLARVPANAAPAEGASHRERVVQLKKGANVTDLVRVLNSLGVTPKDMSAIFQTLKQTGALQAELEIL